MEEKKKDFEVVQKKSNPKKSLLIIIMILLLFVIVVIGTTGYFAVKYAPKIQTYLSSIFSSTQEAPATETNIVITQEESNLVNIVANASPSVVSIAITKLSLSQGEGLVDQNSNIGTGFIVDSAGLVITNQHVVSDLNADYKIITSDSKEYSVLEILRDDVNDLAVLKVDTEGVVLKALTLGDSDKLLVGQDAIAIGTPLGTYAGSVTTGIISGLNRSVTASSGWFGSTAKTYEGVIQTDAAVNPGNSGGPLLNSQGEIIGINFATTADADNISFAIPINKVKSRLDEYRTYGKFIKPYLGITYQMISEYEALYYEDVVPGALILRIDPLAPGYKGGLRRGDIIVKFGEDEVTQSLAELIQRHKVGEDVEVVVLREGNEEKLTVTLGEME